jgi:hypothetical protein
MIAVNDYDDDPFMTLQVIPQLHLDFQQQRFESVIFSHE